MDFSARHIGPSPAEQQQMLAAVGYSSLAELTTAALPAALAGTGAASLDLPGLAGPRSEAEALAELRRLAGKNRVLTSMIGLGYYPTITPPVIRRNVLENPGWYTAYTPYQPEISQGRLEALLNFQTMVADLTGLPQTLAVLATRAEPLGIDLVVARLTPEVVAAQPEGELFGVLLAYPAATGEIADPRPVIAAAHGRGALAAVAADLLALTLLTPPGELGADIAIGTTQRL